MQADNANNRNANARPTKWIPAEVWQRQGMTAQVLTLPGGAPFRQSVDFDSNEINFIFNFRCGHSDEFRRKIKHYFERGSKGDGPQIAERNLHAIGNWQNYCNSHGTESWSKDRQTDAAKFIHTQTHCSGIAAQANHCRRQCNDHQFDRRRYQYCHIKSCFGEQNECEYCASAQHRQPCELRSQ